MLAALVLASRLLLGGLFALAALTKLADREETRRAVVAFGTPEPLAAGIALLLPLAELAVAALLLPAPTALAGALGALGAPGAVLGGDRLEPPARPRAGMPLLRAAPLAPAGPGTLVRNAGLAGVAALALAGTLAGSAPSAVAWLGRLDLAETAILAIGIAAAALLVAGAVVFVSLLRAYGRVLVDSSRWKYARGRGPPGQAPAATLEHGLEPGAPAPAFAVADCAGAEVSLDDLLAPGVPLLLLFASPRCGPCRSLLPEAAMWQREHAGRLTVAGRATGGSRTSAPTPGSSGSSASSSTRAATSTGRTRPTERRARC